MLALYRKYRPQTIDELDLAPIREQLLRTLRSGKISHAYLFAGSRGAGKTSAARIVAKAVNCEKYHDKKKTTSQFGEPCNKCESCRSITDGSALDLIEIDAASNRGIDEMRDLREKIKLSPLRLRYKIYIIDEVHMLTQEAFNALLKTLEEPPPHALFILATTEPHRLPDTILSRCVRLDFRKATGAEITRSLSRVLSGEKVKLPPEVLESIMRQADGSFRDATKLLDQLLAQGGTISQEAFESTIAATSDKVTAEFVTNLSQRDAASCLIQLEKLSGLGVDLTRFTQGVLAYLHELLLIGSGLGERLVKPEKTAEKYTLMTRQIILLDQDKLRTLITLFTQSIWQTKYSPLPQLPLELVVVEWCGADAAVGKQASDEGQTESRQTAPSAVITRSDDISDRDNPGPASNDKTIISEQLAAHDVALSLGVFQEKWTDILKAIKPYNHSVEALLRSCKPLSFDGQTLTLETFYAFHRDKVAEKKVRELIERIVHEVTGWQGSVKTVLGQRPMRKKDVENVSPADDDPLLAAAQEVFGGQVVES